MSSFCNGVCNRLVNGYFGIPKYQLGYRYCTVCEVSLLIEQNVCPCCHSKLRRKPRHKQKICVYYS